MNIKHDCQAHKLKTWPQFFKEIATGKKNFEIRKADRDFRINDILLLKEWDPKTEEYTGKVCTRKITFILPGGSFGIQKDYVALSLTANIYGN